MPVKSRTVHLNLKYGLLSTKNLNDLPSTSTPFIYMTVTVMYSLDASGKKELQGTHSDIKFMLSYMG